MLPPPAALCYPLLAAASGCLCHGRALVFTRLPHAKATGQRKLQKACRSAPADTTATISATTAASPPPPLLADPLPLTPRAPSLPKPPPQWNSALLLLRPPPSAPWPLLIAALPVAAGSANGSSRPPRPPAGPSCYQPHRFGRRPCCLAAPAPSEQPQPQLPHHRSRHRPQVRRRTPLTASALCRCL